MGWRQMGVAAGSLIVLAACGTNKDASTADASARDVVDARADEAAAPGACEAPAAASCPTPPPTYADLAPIFEARCASCHSGAPNAPWPLRDYASVAEWADAIRADLVACTMPPADAGVTMTSDEKQTILVWIACGAPN